SMVTNVKASVKQPDNSYKTLTWLSLSSKHEALRDYTAFDKTKYIDVSFLSTLISDAVKTLTNDNGEIYEKFSFTGTISADVIKLSTIYIDNVTLTLGFDENNEFYFSFMGYINGGPVTDRWIGISYHGGYLTLARKVNTESPEYRVMTMEYFIDNIFAKSDDSTINWLLGASNTIWNIVVSSLPSDVKASCDSGLFLTKDLYLYNYRAQTEEKAVSIYDYIDALRVIINGATSAEINNTANISSLENKLGVYDNYYGVDLNASLITGDVLTELYAAIVRDDNVGISGIKAYGDISGYVSFNVDLTYAEGITEDYVIGSGDPVTGSETAPSFYSAIRESFEAALANVTLGNDEVFGCYFSNNDSVVISKTLERFVLTVHELDGTDTLYEVREGSNVYLYDNEVYVLDASKAMPAAYDDFKAYVDGDGKVVKTIENFSADTEVWAKNFAPATVTIYNNGEKYAVIKSFVGDFMPTEVSGYTILEELKNIDGVLASELGYVEGDISLYGVFAQSEVEVNSVKYSLVKENEEYVYHATGKGALFNDTYCTNGNTLVLENKIGNFRVTAIDAGAFANTDGYCLKSVIVPANIVTVGESAFQNNYGIERIIFLANSVYIDGSGNTDSSTYPFYGCSTYESSEKVGDKKGNEITSLEIYYKNISAKDGNWNIFRYVYNGWWWYFYIGDNGGSLTTSGWYYYDYEIVGAELLGEAVFNGFTFEEVVADKLTTGLATTQIDVDYVQSYLSNMLKRYTAENENCIDKYVVSVTLAVNEFGANFITVSVTEGDALYAVSASSQIGGTVTLIGNTKEYNGKIYANGSVKVTVSDYNSACNLVGWKNVDTGVESAPEGDGSITLEITQATNLIAVFDAELKTVNVASQISFTYGGESPATENGIYQISVAVKDGVPLEAEMKAAGYVFLGWAIENGSSLVFTDMTADESTTYYAIWADNSKSNIVSATQTVTGSLPVDALTVTEGSFYGWYADAEFANSLTAISTDNTILYARMQYQITVSGSGVQLTGITSGGYYAENSNVAFKAEYESGYDNSMSVSYTIDGNTVTYSSAGDYSLTMPSANLTITISAGKSSSSCVAAGTLITLADGSQVAVEELTGNELLLVWNLETGAYDYAPIVFVDTDPETIYEVINLIFSDGTTVKVISEHGFWDYDLNRYVYLDRNAGQYVGHWFNKQVTAINGEISTQRVQLVEVVIAKETTTAYSPVTFGHLCYYVDGMLSMPGGISGLFNIFEVDAETMRYDEELFAQDIQTYGLFTYEDFEDMISEEVFEAFNGQYLKVAIGKGLLDWQSIEELIERYSVFF
ncbi:MAG: InlB B-repeat-containing protein, partial [Candidatus Coproplasma sp.]